MSRPAAGFPGISAATEGLVAVAENFVPTEFGGNTDVDARVRFALQELVNDLYDGFLSKEDRQKLDKDGLLPKIRKTAPPRVELSARLDVLLPSYSPADKVIEFPTWLTAPDCIPGWVSLAHEAAGHAILDAYGLEHALRTKLTRALGKKEGALWKRWFGEAASDCLGVLNLGPTMALGSIVSWRASGRLLQPEGAARMPCAAFEPGDDHPPPVVRAYLMAHATGLLRYQGAKETAAQLKRLIENDLAECGCGKARLKAAELFVETIVAQPHPALNGFRFADLQNWEDRDESIVERLRQVLRSKRLPRTFEAGQYAAHAIAAAILEKVARRQGRNDPRIFPNLIRLLILMYESDRGKKARRELGSQR